MPQKNEVTFTFSASTEETFLTIESICKYLVEHKIISSILSIKLNKENVLFSKIDDGKNKKLTPYMGNIEETI